eukprot:1261497-Rhodomonas_salina.2
MPAVIRTGRIVLHTDLRCLVLCALCGADKAWPKIVPSGLWGIALPLACYACPTQCPVLSKRMVVRGCGTELGYVSTRLLYRAWVWWHEAAVWRYQGSTSIGQRTLSTKRCEPSASAHSLDHALT